MLQRFWRSICAGLNARRAELGPEGEARREKRFHRGVRRPGESTPGWVAVLTVWVDSRVIAFGAPNQASAWVIVCGDTG